MTKNELLRRIEYLKDETKGEHGFTELGLNNTIKALNCVVAHCSEEDIEKWLKDEGMNC